MDKKTQELYDSMIELTDKMFPSDDETVATVRRYIESGIKVKLDDTIIDAILLGALMVFSVVKVGFEEKHDVTSIAAVIAKTMTDIIKVKMSLK